MGIPIWSDTVGWDDSDRADTITLFDLDGDGKDELIGQEHHGLAVSSWSNDWGQWVPASDPSAAAPFPIGSIMPGSLRIGLLAPGQAGAVALAADGSGLETWSWSPGTAEPGTGSWKQESTDGPFGPDDSTGLWPLPAYGSSPQTVRSSYSSAPSRPSATTSPASRRPQPLPNPRPRRARPSALRSPSTGPV